jgi:hypothetical protein
LLCHFASSFLLLAFFAGICLEIGFWHLEFSQWDCHALKEKLQILGPEGKSEILNPKQAQNSNLKCSKRSWILNLDIRICWGFGAWNLGFGAEPL